MKKLETVSRSELLNLNKFLKVEKHAVRLSTGRIIPDWGWIVSPDFVTICAVDFTGRFIGFRQVKYAMDGIAVGPPGGYIERDEIPLEAAKRELLEETGYVSPNWIPLASCPCDANRGNGIANFFLATDCVLSDEPRPASDDVEDVEPVLLTRDELMLELQTDVSIPMPWLLCFSLGMTRLDQLRNKASACIVVAGIIRNPLGNVLIAKRAIGQKQSGLWEFPGGKLEPGETESDCLIREIREEFDASIEITGHFAETSVQTETGLIKLSAWEATALVPNQFTPSVHSEIQWATLSDIRAMRSAFCPADRAFIDKF